MLKGVNFHVYKYSYFLYNSQNIRYILTIFNKVTVNRVLNQRIASFCHSSSENSLLYKLCST